MARFDTGHGNLEESRGDRPAVEQWFLRLHYRCLPHEVSGPYMVHGGSSQWCTIWCTGFRRPAKKSLRHETSERQRKREIIHLLKRGGVTDTVRASSSAKDEAPPSTSGAEAGAGAGADAGAGATLVEALPKKSARGKSSAFFF